VIPLATGILFALCAASGSNAENLSPTAVTDATGDTVTNSTFVSTVSTTATLPTGGGAVLVLASFSSQVTNATAQIGSWQLRVDGGSASQTVERSLSATNSIGMGSAVQVFTGVSAGSHTFDLYQATSGAGMKTYDSTIVALPLVTDAGTALPYGVGSLGSTGVSTTSTTLTPVTGLAATVTLATAGDIFVAAAFDTKSGTGNNTRTGTWRLAIYDSTGTTRLGSVGTQTQRTMTTSTPGAIGTLYGIAEGYAAGTYTIMLEHSTNNKNRAVTTYNATLAAVGLSLANGQVFDSFQTSTASVSTTSTTYASALSGSIDVQDGSSLLLASSFTASSSSAATPKFRLNEDTYNSQEEQLYLAASTTARVSGGVIGLTGALDEATQTARLQYLTTAGTLTLYNPNLVGFSTTSTPEPGTLGLLALAGSGAACFRLLRQRRAAQRKRR